MKKTILTLGCMIALAPFALADGNAFTPLDFNDTNYGKANTITEVPKAQSQTAVSEAEAIGNGSIQNAIAQLENAQVDIRNELLNCKTRYADVDAQYKLIKNERKAVKKQVKAVEKRIKELEKAKEKIRKNML